MAQKTIDVDGVATLFSPVLAHALEPGDLIYADGATARAEAVRRGGFDGRCVIVDCQVLAIDGFAMAPSADRFSTFLNSTVYRAVGARAGRGGAR